jgi:Flp pilus assembly CpaE family ATPase
VTTNELPALHATQRAIAHLERKDIDRSKIKLVVNRYNPDLGLDQEAIETALNVDVFQLLPSDSESLQKALLEGKAVASNTSLGKNFVTLAGRFGGRTAEVKRQSLLSGIFSIFNG